MTYITRLHKENITFKISSTSSNRTRDSVLLEIFRENFWYKKNSGQYFT